MSNDENQQTSESLQAALRKAIEPAIEGYRGEQVAAALARLASEYLGTMGSSTRPDLVPIDKRAKGTWAERITSKTIRPIRAEDGKSMAGQYDVHLATETEIASDSIKFCRSARF